MIGHVYVFAMEDYKLFINYVLTGKHPDLVLPYREVKTKTKHKVLTGSRPLDKYLIKSRYDSYSW